MKTKEEIEDEINSLNRKRMQMIVDIDKLDKEIITISEEYYQLNPDYVKITCIFCNGQGYIDDENKKRVKCAYCNLKGFLWANLWKEKINE